MVEMAKRRLVGLGKRLLPAATTPKVAGAAAALASWARCEAYDNVKRWLPPRQP